MSESPWLFPEIEAEIKEEKSASLREAAQRVREEKRRAIAFLREHQQPWVIDALIDHGPQTEVSIMDGGKDLPEAMKSICTLYYLWRIGKLWRKSAGIHSGSGCESFVYGIRNLHDQNV